MQRLATVSLYLCALASVVFASSLGCKAGSGSATADLAGVQIDIPDGARCSPGSTQSCICLGGGEGVQTCRATGSSYGTCAGCSSPGGDAGLTVVDGGGSPCGTCDGCCDGTTCVALASQTDTQCGSRGQSCSPCSSGSVCVVGSGTCASNSGGLCTTGCEKAVTSPDGGTSTSVCLQDQPSACGTSCTACTYGVTCSGGSCTKTLDSNAAFRVYVQAASVAVTATCPDNWDTFDEPDPQVYVGYQNAGTLVEGYTQYVNDTLSATWDDTTGLITDSSGNPVLVPASAFIAGTVRFTLADYDFPDPNDIIAQGYIPATSTYMASYSTGAFGCATNITFQLR